MQWIRALAFYFILDLLLDAVDYISRSESSHNVIMETSAPETGATKPDTFALQR